MSGSQERYKKKIISCCGTNCGECNYYLRECDGCNELHGKVPWARHIIGGECPIYKCSAEKSVKHSCSECELLPCDIWVSTKDPSMTDEEFRVNLRTRMHELGVSEKIIIQKVYVQEDV